LCLFAEPQQAKEAQPAALISASIAARKLSLPFTVVEAGLGQLRGMTGKAKSCADRVFDFRRSGLWSESEAELALVKPARDES
jgi:hypothetical protein